MGLGSSLGKRSRGIKRIGGLCSCLSRGFFLARRRHRQIDLGVTINEPRINERIRVPEVRLVGPAGEQVGIVRVEDALRLAQERDLDLVEVAPTSRPPVAKLKDYGKFKYEAAVKARESRRNQANTEVKEMRFRLKIDDHDYETKKGHVLRFLKAGDKVKVTIMFRGREQSRPEMGRRLLQRLAEDVIDYAVVENAPTQEGRNMSLVLGPLKKKAEAMADARAEREAKRSDKAKSPVSEGEAAAKQAAAEDAAGPKKQAAQKKARPVDGEEPAESTRPLGRKKATTGAPTPAPKKAPAKKPAVTKAAPAKEEDAAEKKPAPKKPAAKKPAAAKPAAAKKPAAKKPAAKKTTTKKASDE